jgi:hypothetical protein
LLINCFAIIGLVTCCFNRFAVLNGNLEKLYYFDHLNKRDENFTPVNPAKDKLVEINMALINPEKISDKSKSFEAKDQSKPIDTEEVVFEPKQKGENITLFTRIKKEKVPERSTPPKSGGICKAQEITLKDLNNIWGLEMVTTDKRTCNKIYIDYLSERTFISLFLKTSAIEPFWVRYTYCLMFLSILFTINAMMYSDEYIDAKVNLPQPVRVSIT